MKLLSEASESGLRAVVWMARRPQGLHKVKEIAEGIQAAPGYLVKVLQDLARSGILSARRGSQGGFSLLRKPEGLTVLEVISAIDPIERIKNCPLQLDAHGQQLCPLHRRIDDALASVERSFRSSTIADLLTVPQPAPTQCNALCRPPAPDDSQDA
ncbi:MAG: Rrf2 family transcriptional regulator [Pirellulaceae bacterium]|nr:Rrf2 family transcriptional regulator [Pirellulaceae bacterium]